MNVLNKENKVIWDILSNFVNKICKGRDESHGYVHMKNVAQSALKITYVDYKDHKSFDYILQNVIIVAWLHDVYDHKYDYDNTLKHKVLDFLNNQTFVSSSKKIMNIIDRISYSQEVKCKNENKLDEWNDILGEDGMIIRDIVSDADKLEALGVIGFNRCSLYIKEYYLKKTGKNIPYELLKENIVNHANEKLLKLKDEFIRTKKGKEMAEPLHNEFVDLLNLL